jgi:hypothetical protein
MAKPTDSRVLWTLSLTGGLFTALGLSMVELLMYIWAWVTSGGHPIGEPPNLVKMFDASTGVAPIGAISSLLLAFGAGTAAVHFVSKRPRLSIIESPLTSSGLPRKGFIYGLLCGLASCILFVSLETVVGIVLDSFKHDVSVGLLLFGPLAFSGMALFLVGVPVAIIGGIVGSITELVLRRIYRASEPSEDKT